MKQSLALALALILLVSVLSGCSQVVSSGTTETTETYAPTEAATIADTQQKEDATVSYQEKSTEPLLELEDIKPATFEGVDEDYQTAEPKNGDKIAILHTNYGDISFKFLEEVAPLAVNNFIALANDKRYDDTIFHRVISNFMIQGGDYTNYDGTGGASAYGTEFKNETTEYVKNIEGAVAMANRGADTNGSQFYINQVDNDYLDGNYTVFGQVFDGMDIVDAIASVQTGMNDRPQSDVILESVEISTYE